MGGADDPTIWRLTLKRITALSPLGQFSCKTGFGHDTQNPFYKKDGRGERIRTFDPLVPNQMRYQAALHPDWVLL